MKRTYVIAALIFLMTGCSWEVTFFIYNLTNEPVTIQYVLKIPSEGQIGVFKTNPEIFSITSKADEIILTKKTDGKIEFDEQRKMVTARLGGKEALDLGTAHRNFMIDKLEDRKGVCSNLEQLIIIKNEADTLTCKGSLAHLLLTELKTHAYGIKIE